MRLKGCLSSVSVENVPLEETTTGRSIEDKGFRSVAKENSKPEISRFSSKCSPGYVWSARQSRVIEDQTPSPTKESLEVPTGVQSEEKGCQTKITAIVSNSDVLAKIALPQKSEIENGTTVSTTSEEKVNGSTAKTGEKEGEKNALVSARKTRSLSAARDDDSFGVRELSTLRRSSAPAVDPSRERKTWKREMSINEDDVSEQSGEESGQKLTSINRKANQVDKKTQVSELEIGTDLKRACRNEKKCGTEPDSRAIRGDQQRMEKIEESDGSSGSSTSDTSESSSDSSDSDDSLEDYGKTLKKLPHLW